MPVRVGKYTNIDSEQACKIKYIVKPEIKYGVSINDLLGSVDENGMMLRPTGAVYVNFAGVKSIEGYALYYRFANCQNVVSVVFPDLETSENLYGMYDAFYRCESLITVDFPKAKKVSMAYAFSYCSNLENIYMPKLEIMYGMSYSFQNTKATNLVMPNVKNISGANYCFYGCKMTSVDLSSVEIITGSAAYMFAQNPNLVSADFSGLKSIDVLTSSTNSRCYGMFYNDENLESLDMSNLETIIGMNAMTYMCYGCKKLKSMVFNKLSKVGTLTGGYSYYEFQRAFQDSGLETLSFPALNSNSFIDYEVFNNMLLGVTGCTVHFPSNLQSVIGNWHDVVNGFGGTNTVVLFDLPATE